MAEKEKVTTMVLDVNLQCPKCYKKVKKILCKFPQIRDQVYDEKANKVTIKVVCCSPEKIRDKLCCKGGGCIKRIEILPPPKPKEPEKPKPPPEKPKEPEKPKPQPEKPKEPEKPKPPPEKPKEPEKPKPPPPEKPKEPEKPKPPPEKPKEPEKPKPPPPPPVPVCYPPPPCPPPMGFCCTDCYHGVPGGPCFRGWPIQYDGYCGRPVYDSWGGGSGGYRSSYVSRCDYFSEENPQGCSIM